LCGLDLTFHEDIGDHVALVTFAQQQDQASGSWLQARWHGQEREDAVTVRQFLSFEAVNEINPYQVREKDTAERRAFAGLRNRTAALLHLQPLWNRLMLQLSNGEMRRVLLSRALLQSPRLLVLDDPYAGLDTAMQACLHEILDRLAADGLPMVLMVRHSDEIPSCATHLLNLQNLKITGHRLLSKRHTPGKKKQRQTQTRFPLKNAKGVGKPIIELHDVKVRYGRRVILDCPEWIVRAGERWWITGPNGSGKTTLLSLITGDNPMAYANDVRVFGHTRTSGESLWAIRRRIGQVSPELQCYFDTSMSCLEAVLSGRFDKEGRLRAATASDRQAARRWLFELGLQGREQQPFGTLSAGYQRLVLLARALLPQPDLLLLDEPCLHLDTVAHRHVLRVFEQLMHTYREKTVVYVAHRPDDIPRGFTRILNLKPR
jgi:molybdate transport system ATP-binding protein